MRVYAPERPSEAELTAWYLDSRPALFWRERVLPASAEARRDKIIRPRAQGVLDGISEYAADASRLVDVSTDGRTLLEGIR